MHNYARSRRWRENFVFVAFAILFGGGLFLFLLLVSGALLWATLAVLLVMLVVGFFHYMFWGRTFEQQIERQISEPAKGLYPPSVNGDVARHAPRSSPSDPR